MFYQGHQLLGKVSPSFTLGIYVFELYSKSMEGETDEEEENKDERTKSE